MIRLTDGIWIGDSADGRNLGPLKIGTMLNVAHDLHGWWGWPEVEYMQVGLLDGPGNPLAAYYAAVLALATLLSRRRNTLVCCHTGGRSMAVVLMYLSAIGDGCDWDELLTLLSERVDLDLPVPHKAHKTAFGKMNWRLLTSMIGD